MENKQDSEKFRNFAIAFLKEAQNDLETVEELIENKRFAKAVFFSQQCVEKSIKALLEMEKIFIAEHDLSTFFVRFIYNNKKYTQFKEKLDELLEDIDYFEGEWSRTRYPKEQKGKVLTPTEIYKYEDAVKSQERSRKVLMNIKEILKEKFGCLTEKLK